MADDPNVFDPGAPREEEVQYTLRPAGKSGEADKSGKPAQTDEDGAPRAQPLPAAYISTSPGEPPQPAWQQPDAVAALGLGKKRKRRWIPALIIALAVVAIVIFMAARSAMQGTAPTYVELYTAGRGDIHQTLSTSGTLTTGRRATVFSPASAPLTAVNAQDGQVVQAGSLLFAFDTHDLQLAYQQAASSYDISNLQSQSAVNASNKSQQQANDAQASIDEMAGQKSALQDQVNDLIAQKAGLEEQYATQAAALKELEKQLKQDPKNQQLKDAVAAKTAEVEGIESALKTTTTTLAGTQEQVATYEGSIAQMEATRDAAQAAVMDDTARAMSAAEGTGSQIALQQAQEALAAAQAGVSAPFTGVVTNLQAEVGALASQYTPLCVIESLDKVDVLVALSRYDLERVQVGQQAIVTTLGREYAGQVTRIDSIVDSSANVAAAASGNSTSNFINATISLKKPDGDIKLGLDASVEIATGLVEDVVTVPISAINTDVDGTYCFVAVDGVARRQSVTLGLSSDTDVEVTEGIAVGDEVILASQNITEGTPITTDPAYQLTQGGIMGMMVG